MILKLRIGHWRITITLTPVVDVIGVNSKLPDGNHILMWDFDNTSLRIVEHELRIVQLLHNLSNIYILETTKNRNYIAYCFTRVTWQQCKEILASTIGLCENFYKWGVFRKRFTLRVGAKCGRKPKLVSLLQSLVPEDTSIDELRSWVRYETLQDEAPNIIIKLGEPKCQK